MDWVWTTLNSSLTHLKFGWQNSARSIWVNLRKLTPLLCVGVTMSKISSRHCWISCSNKFDWIYKLRNENVSGSFQKCIHSINWLNPRFIITAVLNWYFAVLKYLFVVIQSHLWFFCGSITDNFKIFNSYASFRKIESFKNEKERNC